MWHAALQTMSADAAGAAGGDSTFATMARVFLVAVVIVVPFAAIRARRLLADSRARRAVALPDGPPSDHGERGADPSAAPPVGTLSRVVADIDAAAAAGVPAEVEVPAGPLLGTRPAPDGVVEQIIADAIDRCGLEVESTETLADGRRLIRLRPPR